VAVVFGAWHALTTLPAVINIALGGIRDNERKVSRIIAIERHSHDEWEWEYCCSASILLDGTTDYNL